MILRVKNWEKFQHYKDRNPPWIKFHRSLLDDYAFSQLPDSVKGLLPLLWLLASGTNGEIPDDPRFIQSKLCLQKPPNLQILVKSGFLIKERDLEEETEEEEERETYTAEQSASKMLAKRNGSEAVPESFNAFWQAYPKRESRGAAEKSYIKALTLTDPQTLLSAAERYADAVKDRERKFVKMPTTWLNQKCWMDELQPEGKTYKFIPFA